MSLTDYQRFLSSAPEAEREYRTIEIFHPDFSAPVRLVQDFVDQSFTLEASAPRNPSTVQLFTAISMRIEEPGESGDIDQVLTVSLGAIGNEVQDAIDQIDPMNSLTPIEVIYRKYHSSDLTEPVLVLYQSAANVQFKGYSGVSFTAEDSDLTTKLAGELYTLERFPTLRGI